MVFFLGRENGGVRTSLLLILLLFSFGISGFILIEGFSFTDAFYMTLITVSTVGFEEIRPLSPEGRLFTSFLIIGGISIWAYSLTNIVRAIVDGELRQARLKKKMDKEISLSLIHI